MGILDQLALRAAGAAGSFQQGRLKGEAVRYDRDQAEQERRAEIERRALERALVERRDAQVEQFRRDQLAQQAADRQAAREAQEANLQEQIRARAEEAAKQREFVAGQNDMNRGLRRDLAPRRGGPEAGKNLPASAVRDVNEWQSLRDSAVEAANAFNSIPKGQNVSGGIVGRVAGALGQFGIGTGEGGLNSPTAISARSKLSNISTALGKLRSGGAITPEEYDRLEPMIPNKNDDEDVVRSKLADLSAYLERKMSRDLDTYEGSGYDVTKVRSGAPAPANQPSAPDGLEEARQEALDAIRQGAPAAEVRRRFRAEFGQDLRP